MVKTKTPTRRSDVKAIRLRSETRKRLDVYAHLQARSVWRVADHILSQFLDEKIGCQFYEDTKGRCGLLRDGVGCEGKKASCKHDAYRKGELYI